VAATLGGLIGLAANGISHRALCGLVSFAAGALLSVTALHIVPEAAEMVGWKITAASVTSGVMLFYLIGKYVAHICPACAASVADQRTGYLRLGILLMVALGIHSTIDGLAIAVGAETEAMLGILVLFAVSYHKVPEGLALVSVSRLAGYGRSTSLLIAVLVELTTGIGALIGLAASGLSFFWVGVILAQAGGSFLYVVGFALFTEWREHARAPIVAYLAVGFLTIVLLSYVLQRAGAFPNVG